MTPLTVVIPFHKNDLTSAERLLDWIHELDTPRQHACLLVADSKVDKAQRDKLRDNAHRSFLFVSSLPVAVPAIGFAPNHMFLAAARQIQYANKHAWLWLEPDCVPLRRDWLTRLATAYEASPKKFMGQIVRSQTPGLPEAHLTGCSIYSPDAFADVYSKVESLKGQSVAWDIECAGQAVPRSQHTDLIQHVWGEAGWPPTFVMNKIAGQEYAKNVVDMSFLRPSAVLFHRCKDDSLINMLRLKRQSDKLNEQPSREPTVEVPAHRGPGRPRKNPAENVA